MALAEDIYLSGLLWKKGAVITAISLFALVLSGRLLKKRPSQSKLPPGPLGLPFIGNLLQLARAPSPFSLFPSWVEEYGDVVHFSAFGKHMIVLGSLEGTIDLLEKRGAIYSDRPNMVLENEVLGWEAAMPSMRYGEKFRRHRRLSQALLNPTVSRKYSAMHEDLVMKLLASISQTPDHFRSHILVYASATVLKLTYDIDIESEDDPFLKLSHDAVKGTSEAYSTAGSLVDFFPLLKSYFTSYPDWLPFSGFKSKMAQLRKDVLRSHHIPYDNALEKIRTGSAPLSIVTHAVEVYGGLDNVKEGEHDEIRGLAGVLFAAGQETSMATLTSFVLAMVLYPDVQKKAQAEVELVIPHSRLPTLDDRESLPYINALVMEVYRWGSPLAASIPHDTLEDDVYNGHFIPKGSSVFASILDIMNACPRPEVFSPQRFIDGTELGKVPKDTREVAFGFGRRRCPGMHVADNSVWTAIAQMLTIFEFHPEVIDGKEVLPPQEFGDDLIARHPKPFRCRILVREGKERLIHSD